MIERIPGTARLLGEVRANPRLLYMLAAIGLILGVLVIQMMVSYGADRRAEATALAERRERLLALSQSDDWLPLADEAQDVLDTLEASLPEARSPGLAQAMFQSWVRDRTLGMDGEVFFETGTAQPVESIDGVVRVTAKISGRSHRNTVIDLLRRAEASPNLIVVDAFSLPAETSNGFTASLSAYYRVAGTVPEETTP